MRDRIKSNRASVRLLPFLLLSVFAAGCVSRGVERFDFGAYSQGDKLFQKGKYAEAILKYQAYIEENPVGNMAVIARYSIGKSYLALSQGDQAKACFEQIAAEHKGLIWAELSDRQLQEMASSGETQ